MDKERDLLERAVHSITGLEGLQDGIVSLNRAADPGPFDGVLEIEVNGSVHHFALVVKTHLTKCDVGALAARVSQHKNDSAVVVSQRIPPAMAALLRDHSLCYVDAAGNCFLQDGPLFVLVEGRKGEPVKERPLRMFQEAGLRLIFVLLLDPERASFTYRDLADMAGVSRGAVGYVFTDLLEEGYIVETRRGRRKIAQYDALLDKWISHFGETLRPKLARRQYRFTDEDQRRNWRTIPVKTSGSLWGGEPAAGLLTSYLRPERFTLYSDADISHLVKETGLLPDPEGPIEVLRPFWKDDAIAHHLPRVEPPCVPPLLVYADLLVSGAPRNVEAAQLLHDHVLSG